jgi:hypothetical protein
MPSRKSYPVKPLPSARRPCSAGPDESCWLGLASGWRAPRCFPTLALLTRSGEPNGEPTTTGTGLCQATSSHFRCWWNPRQAPPGDARRRSESASSAVGRRSESCSGRTTLSPSGAVGGGPCLILGSQVKSHRVAVFRDQQLSMTRNFSGPAAAVARAQQCGGWTAAGRGQRASTSGPGSQ